MFNSYIQIAANKYRSKFIDANKCTYPEVKPH